MALQKIITPENPILTRKAQRVRTFDRKLHVLLDDMVETLEHAKGVGLAAPQVAVSQRVLIVRLPDDEESREEYGEDAGVLYEVVNPEVIRRSPEMVDGVEACLSIPGYFGLVERHEWIVVRALDRNGKEIRIKPRGWLARVFQHEIDHLEGVLYTSRASEVWKAGETPEHIYNQYEERESQAPTGGDPQPGA